MVGRDPLRPVVEQEAAIDTVALVASLADPGLTSRPAAPTIDIPNPVSGLTSFVGDRIVEAFSALLRALADDFLKHLAGPVARYVLRTPDLLAEPTLRRFWLVSLSCLFAVAMLLVTIAGTAMIPGSTSRFSLAAREALGVRLVSSMLTAAVSLPLVALEVELANRVVDALVPVALGEAGSPLWSAFNVGGTSGLAALVVVVVGVVLLVGLTILGLARWATLWLLVVLEPVAMGFSMLPGGAGVARLWWRLQLMTVFLPLANAALLGAYVAMFASERTGMVGALSGVAVLVLMVKLPRWAAGFVVGVEGDEVMGRLRHSRHVVSGWSINVGGSSHGRDKQRTRTPDTDRSRTPESGRTARPVARRCER